MDDLCRSLPSWPVCSLMSMSDQATPITVAIVDDHVMVADMLATVIESEADLHFVGVAKTVAEGLELVERTQPQVVLMDYRLPDGDGIKAVRAIRSRWPETHLVMLSGADRNDLLALSIEAGCVGLVSKDRPVEEVLAAVRAAARGEVVIKSDDFAGLLHQLTKTPSQATHLLTARELEVLQLLARARSTESIATELFISVNTVRNHVANILSKLGAHSKLEAVAIAAREGLIAADELGR